MTTYIRTCAEKRTSNDWQLSDEPFHFQSNDMLVLFAAIRNDSGGCVMAEPRGFRVDMSEDALH